MMLFLTTFVVVYLLLNMYVFRWLKPAFNWRTRGTLGFFLFVGIMISLPFIVRYCQDRDFFDTARYLGMVAYSWLAVVMWVFCFGLLVEAWNLAVALAAIKTPAYLRFKALPSGFIKGLAVCAVLFIVWGMVEAHCITLKTIEITTPRLPKGSRPLKIVQVSDVHIGLMIGQEHTWNRMLELVNQAKPDIVLATGDMFDSASDRLSGFVSSFSNVNPPLGKYAVLGNHEFFIETDRVTNMLARAGFRVLRSENAAPAFEGTNICIAGVDDDNAARMRADCRSDENKALPPATNRPFTVFLKHSPIANKATFGRFDLQISGHLHGGQIFPFQLFVWLTHKTFTGLHILENGSYLYVSPGVGTWGPPIRVFAPPAVTLILVRPELSAAVSDPSKR